MTTLPSGTVTFLFTDIQDSTRLWEEQPSVMGRVLARHDEIIETLAQEHDGYVVRPRGEGDSRFVVFERAHDGVAATAAIQQALYAEEWPEAIPLRVRMALHTGEGEYREGDYYGTAVNRCARLRGLAHGGQVLFSQSTYELVQDGLPEGVRALDLGQHLLKGLERPEQIYQLAAPGLPTEFPPLGGLGSGEPLALLPSFLLEEARAIERPVFVAREGELDRLDGYLERALAGEGQVVFVTGGAGRGKTALIDEFCRRSLETHEGLVAVRGACNAHSGVGDPYLPFRDVFGVLAGDIQGPWAAREITHQQATLLWQTMPRAVDAILERGTSLLEVFVAGEDLYQRLKAAAPFETERLNRLRKLVDRQNSGRQELEQSLLFEQATNVLQRLAQDRPHLLVLDDLQWADHASLDLLFHLGRRMAGSPVLVIGAYRPDEVALGAGSGRHPLENVVNELKRVFGNIMVDLGQQVEAEDRIFVEDLIDSEPNRLDADFRRALLEHTDGHPLFTIELLRAMQERGDLGQDEQSRWVVARELAWDRLPARVEAVVEERIGRLEHDLRDLLSVASVEGEDFTAQVVARVQEIKERRLLHELSQELEKRHRLVREQGELDVDGHLLSRFRFAHQLYQRYLYNNLGLGERRLLHREIAEVLEDIYAGHADDHAVQLALHYSQAGMREKAVHYLTEAGHQARAKYANVEAIRCYTEALTLLPGDDGRRSELLLSRTRVCGLLGRHEEQRADVEELLNLARAQGDERLLCDALLAQADYSLDTEFTLAKEPAEQALEIATALGDKVRQAQALRYIGFWAWHRDELYASKAALESAYRLFHEAGLLAKAASCLHHLSLALRSLDEFGAALEMAEESVALAREAGDARQEASGLRRMAIAYMGQHRYAEALPLTEQALTLHRELGDRVEEINALNVLGIIHAWLQDQAASERYLRESHELAKTSGYGFGTRAAAHNLHEYLYQPRGEYEDWLGFVDTVAEAARASEDAHLMAYCQVWRIETLRVFGLHEKALELVDALILSADEIASTAEQAMIRHLRCQMLAELGDFASARETHGDAVDRARETGLEIFEIVMRYPAAYVALLEGDHDRMRTGLEQLLSGLDAVRGTNDQQDVAAWLTTAARISQALGEHEQALLYSSEVMQLLGSVPNIHEQEVKLYTHARALLAAGREEGAMELLQQAYDRVMLVAEKTRDETLRQGWFGKRTNREIMDLYRRKVVGT